jgi:hypothetical protein
VTVGDIWVVPRQLLEQVDGLSICRDGRLVILLLEVETGQPVVGDGQVFARLSVRQLIARRCRIFANQGLAPGPSVPSPTTWQ